MRFVLERVTDPDIEPITAAEFVRNVGEFQSAATTRADDISDCIKAAREWAEKETSRALIDQKWRLTLTDQITGYDAVEGPANGYVAGFTVSGCDILLRRSPVIAITSFVSVGADGTEIAIDADTYELREAGSKAPRIVALTGSPWGTGTYRIEFRAGYADRLASPQQDASDVPARFRRAILLYAEALYDSDKENLMEVAASLIASENINTGVA